MAIGILHRAIGGETDSYSIVGEAEITWVPLGFSFDLFIQDSLWGGKGQKLVSPQF